MCKGTGRNTPPPTHSPGFSSAVCKLVPHLFHYSPSRPPFVQRYAKTHPKPHFLGGYQMKPCLTDKKKKIEFEEEKNTPQKRVQLFTKSSHSPLHTPLYLTQCTTMTLYPPPTAFLYVCPHPHPLHCFCLGLTGNENGIHSTSLHHVHL